MMQKVRRKKSWLGTFTGLMIALIVVVALVCYIAANQSYRIIQDFGDDVIRLPQSNSKVESKDRTTDPLTTTPASDLPILDTLVSDSPKVDKGASLVQMPEILYSPHVLLLRLEDAAVLMEKNSNDIIYPASLTKIMTAIVAIENLTDLKEEIKLDDAMFRELYKANASMAGFEPGERVSAIDLLYGVMLPSGAESCIGLANHIAGSEKSFVELMNQKAEELGMENTHFENTTGLHDDNHYTTAKDLAILLSNALQNDIFHEIFTAPRHNTKSTDKHPGGITFKSTMFEKLSNHTLTNGAIIGGKTGYTDKAGLCLASLAQVDNQEYILITAGAKGDHYTEPYHISDAIAVYNRIP